MGSKTQAKVFIPQAGNFSLVFADYEDSRLNRVDIVSLTISEDEIGERTVVSGVNISLDKGDKVMLLQGLKPICEAFTVE